MYMKLIFALSLVLKVIFGTWKWLIAIGFYRFPFSLFFFSVLEVQSNKL